MWKKERFGKYKGNSSRIWKENEYRSKKVREVRNGRKDRL